MAKSERKKRLDAILRVSEAATAQELESGHWDRGVCPFSLREPDGKVQIRIEKGDVILQATAASFEEALSALERKVGIVYAEGGDK